MEISVSACKRMSTRGWSADEDIVHDVRIRLAVRVSSDIATSCSPVVDYVVHKLVDALDFGVTIHYSRKVFSKYRFDEMRFTHRVLLSMYKDRMMLIPPVSV
jgi:hypothetical protein